MSLRRPTVALLSFTFNISPLCDVAQTSDCGMFVSYFQYKPFMWCSSDVRLWHALSFFSVISPLCGVAPTPDCGIIILVVSSRGVIQTLVWHQYYYSCSFLSRSHSDPRLAPSIYFGISGGLPPDFSFISHAVLSLCLSALVNLFKCIMFTFVISYVRTVLRVLS